MKTTYSPKKYTLFIDESGISNGSDPNQDWFVLAGICIPDEEIDYANQYYDSIIRRYLKIEQINKPKFELKGRLILRPSLASKTLGLSLKERIMMCRELLSIDIAISDVTLFIYAINTKSLDSNETKPFYDWSSYLPKELQDNVHLWTLCDLISHFAFFLDQDASSGLDVNLAEMRGEPWIDRGSVCMDETSLLVKPIKKFEASLRQQRPFIIGDKVFPDFFQLLEDNIESPLKLCDSKSTYMIQIADILASLVHFRLKWPDPPFEFIQLYDDICLSFQQSCRFLPRSGFPQRESLEISEGRYRLLRKYGIIT